MKTIKGKVVFNNLSTSCWGIVDAEGGEWRPINMPEQLKKVGREAVVHIEEIEEGFSIFMWGTAVEVVGFNT